jgi:hypothetical protein
VRAGVDEALPTEHLSALVSPASGSPREVGKEPEAPDERGVASGTLWLWPDVPDGSVTTTAAVCVARSQLSQNVEQSAQFRNT